MYQLKPLLKKNITKGFGQNIPIQPKLKIGQPGDKYEQEADALADRVMNMNQSETMQMQPVEEEEKLMQPKLRMQSIEEEEEAVQMKCAECEDEEMLQAKSDSGGGFASPVMSHDIQTSKGNGKNLPGRTNQFMSNAFGADFSGVQIHTGSDSVKMNQQLGARAFTHGNDIYFNKGEYSPESSNGKSLLAHELTHVVQQGGRIPVDFIQRDFAVEPPNPDAEVRELTEEEINDAIGYNSRKFNNEGEISNLRDVLGVNPLPAIFDAELIDAIVQYQAENNLNQDGKIGTSTARPLGREMLAESTLDPSQRNPGIRMLERGIRLYFTGNNYNDGANTSQKLIRFNVNVPQGLNLRDYALVQFISGQILRVPGPANPNVTMYGNNVPFNFPNPQVDSVDTDPIYWSDAPTRWRYGVSGRTFSATDDPGRSTHLFNPGDSADLSFRIGVYRVSDLPVATTGNIGRAQPIQSGTWRFSVVNDAAGNITHP